MPRCFALTAQSIAAIAPAIEPSPFAVQHRERHQGHPRGDPGDADAVVADGPDDPGHVGPVAVLVGARALLGERVVAVGAVGAAADADPVVPQVADEIRVGRVDAAVQHPDDDVA